MSCDIIMGNVAPLKQRMKEIRQLALQGAAYWNGPEARAFEEIALLALDNSREYVRDIHVEGDLTSLQWSGGDV